LSLSYDDLLRMMPNIDITSLLYVLY